MKTAYAVPLLILFVVPFLLVELPGADLPSPQSASVQTHGTDKPAPSSAKSASHPTAPAPRASAPVASAPEPVPTSADHAGATAPAAPTEANHGSLQTTGSLTLDIEEEVVRLMNAERTDELPDLSHSDTLREIARRHSADMLANDYFSHDRPDGCSSSCRATEAGYRWQTIGENIYVMSGFKLGATDAAHMVVDGWMQSEGHRANILRAAFTEVGVGVASDGTSYYVTALYARPR